MKIDDGARRKKLRIRIKQTITASDNYPEIRASFIITRNEREECHERLCTLDRLAGHVREVSPGSG